MQGGADRIDLGQHVHAIAVLLNHSDETPYLPFNPLKAGNYRRSDRVIRSTPPLILYPHRVYVISKVLSRPFSGVALKFGAQAMTESDTDHMHARHQHGSD